MTDDTRLTLRRPPAGRPVRLTFGEREGLSLSFWRPPGVSPGPVKLTFGDDGTAPPEAPTATLTAGGRITGLHGRVALQAGASVRVMGAISGLRGRIAVRALSMLQVSGTLTGLRLCIAARYNVNVQRPTVANTTAHWQDAQQQHADVRSAYQQSPKLNVGTRSRWQDAAPIAVQQREHWRDTLHQQHAATIAFEQAQRLPASSVRSAFQEAQRLHHAARTTFQQALRLPVAPLRQRFQDTYRDRQRRVGAHFQTAAPLARAVATGMGIAAPLQRTWGGRYQQAWPPRPGIWTPPVTPPGPGPCYVPTLPALLLFADPFEASLPARLVFQCDGKAPGPHPGTTVVVPVKRVYIVINDATLRRVDGNIPLPTFSMSMSLDTDSWTWGFNAALHHAALPNLAPSAFGDPVELEALVNGVPYRFLAEQLATDRSFGQSSLRVSGRGIAATLDAPYAPVLNFGNTAERTAQQLMSDVLTVNGVSLGWGVDWQIADWLVPAGVWTHQGSYIGALNSIVQAAGGYLQPHGVDKTLKALLRYPSAPWEWGASPIDFELPADVTTQEGIAWQENPRYNRVFVSGTSAGVLGQVTRAGTDGALVAPMVTDALITHEIAARQRAIAALAPSGRQAKVTLKLPVLDSTGIIPPGKMVRYVDGATTRVGITRGVQVGVQMPEIFQQIEVETYA